VEFLQDGAGKVLRFFRRYDILVPLMATNVQITKNNNENAASVLRRFTKKVRGAGFLQEVRDRRYYTRKPSALRRKNSKMVVLERTDAYNEKKKMGQVEEK
jgi:ribosomal protein S21